MKIQFQYYTSCRHCGTSIRIGPYQKRLFNPAYLGIDHPCDWVTISDTCNCP